MEQRAITETLEHLQSHLERVNDPALAAILPELFNVIEAVVSENVTLQQANQGLRDEVNRLKGEQGKPDVKPNSPPPPSISSERERQAAERDDLEGVSQVGFHLASAAVEKLKEHRIPEAVLDQLAGMQGIRYADKATFLQAVEEAVGPEIAQEYQALLVKYARYTKRRRLPKVTAIEIDREEICPVDPAVLPADAQWKGYTDKVVQEVRIQRDTVKFRRETWYSPSHHQTYLGAVPTGHEGEFGPHLNTHILSMKYVNGMSIPKIHEFYETLGIRISRTYLSDRLTKHLDVFHQEKAALYDASLDQGRYHHIDDTTSRVNGQNHYTHIVCSPYATLFFTTPRKDRLTILDILQDGEARYVLFNAEAVTLLEQLKVPKTYVTRLQELDPDRHFTDAEMAAILAAIFPDPATSPIHQRRIQEAGAIASYHQQLDHPIVEVLVCDDAPQFKLLTEEVALCWVHEGRHYKRLQPIVPEHRTQLDDFLRRFWAYYRRLYVYKQAPSEEQARIVSAEFDTLFSPTTGYDELDERIMKSAAKKSALLTVLRYPEVPLHNNPAEHGARVQKRRADVSLHTKNDLGTQAKDTMMSIVETCKKLGVNAYDFIYDRISHTFNLPSLADMIRAKSGGQSKSLCEEKRTLSPEI
jgi:regulator of replication initiation timing